MEIWLKRLLLLDVMGWVAILGILVYMTWILHTTSRRLLLLAENWEKKIAPLVENADRLVSQTRQDIRAIRESILSALNVFQIFETIAEGIQSGFITAFLNLFKKEKQKASIPQEGSERRV